MESENPEDNSQDNSVLKKQLKKRKREEKEVEGPAQKKKKKAKPEEDEDYEPDKHDERIDDPGGEHGTLLDILKGGGKDVFDEPKKWMTGEDVEEVLNHQGVSITNVSKKLSNLYGNFVEVGPEGVLHRRKRRKSHSKKSRQPSIKRYEYFYGRMEIKKSSKKSKEELKEKGPQSNVVKEEIPRNIDDEEFILTSLTQMTTEDVDKDGSDEGSSDNGIQNGIGLDEKSPSHSRLNLGNPEKELSKMLFPGGEEKSSSDENSGSKSD